MEGPSCSVCPALSLLCLKEPAKAFFVDVSEALNTPTVIFSGKLIARIGLATNKPAEFIILSISQDTRALEAELAAAGA